MKKPQKSDGNFWTFFNTSISTFCPEKVNLLNSINSIFLPEIIHDVLNHQTNHFDCCYTLELKSNFLQSSHIPKNKKIKLNFTFAVSTSFWNFCSINASIKPEFINGESDAINSLISNINNSSFILIYDFDNVDSSFLEKLLIRLLKKKCMVFLFPNLSTNLNAKIFDNCVKIDSKILEDIYLTHIKEVLSSYQKDYILAILANQKVLSKYTLLDNLDSLGLGSNIEIFRKYDSIKNLGSSFNSEYFTSNNNNNVPNSNELSNSEKFNYVLKAIKLVRKYDPFNFKLIGVFYAALGIKEFQDELNQLFYNSPIEKENLLTHEGKVHYYLDNCHKLYRKNNSEYFILQLHEAYEYFLNCFKNDLNYGVISLGTYLTSQFHNYGLVQKSQEIYTKLNITLKLIEGEYSINTLNSINLFLGYTATAIFDPASIYEKYSNELTAEEIKQNLKENLITAQLFYSNILGCFLVNECYSHITEKIYNAFKTIKVTEYKNKIYNNLVLYELINDCEQTYITKVLNIIDSESNELNHFITYYNLSYLFRNNYEKLSYIQSYFSDHFYKAQDYDFYYFHLAFYNDFFNIPDDECTLINASIPQMYKNRSLEQKIKGILHHNCKNPQNKKFIFIDQNYWGE